MVLLTASAIPQGARSLRNGSGRFLLAIVTISLGGLPGSAQQPIHLIPVITTVAGNGTNGYYRDGGAAISAELNNPNVAVDASGNLYITDFSNNLIRKVSTDAISSYNAAFCIHKGRAHADDGARTPFFPIEQGTAVVWSRPECTLSLSAGA